MNPKFKIVGDFSCSMGNNSQDPFNQRAEEGLWIRTWKGIMCSWCLNWKCRAAISSFILLLKVYMELFCQVIAGIVKRMDKGAEIENVGAWGGSLKCAWGLKSGTICCWMQQLYHIWCIGSKDIWSLIYKNQHIRS